MISWGRHQLEVNCCLVFWPAEIYDSSLQIDACLGYLTTKMSLMRIYRRPLGGSVSLGERGVLSVGADERGRQAFVSTILDIFVEEPVLSTIID